MAKKSKQSKKRISLNPLREQLRVLVNQANRRVEAIVENGLQSRALNEAARTFKKMRSRTDESELFKADLKTRKQINREFARVHAFLNDYTSTITGAHDFETDLGRLSGAFGRKWYNGADDRSFYDTSRIDKELATKTFDIYRRVVEAAGGWERAIGIFTGKESLVGFGSETLINAIYDMVENEMKDEDIFITARDMIEEGLEAYREMARKQVSDYDYGIVFDDPETESRRDFYFWRRNRRRGL